MFAPALSLGLAQAPQLDNHWLTDWTWVIIWTTYLQVTAVHPFNDTIHFKGLTNNRTIKKATAVYQTNCWPLSGSVWQTIFVAKERQFLWWFCDLWQGRNLADPSNASHPDSWDRHWSGQITKHDFDNQYERRWQNNWNPPWTNWTSLSVCYISRWTARLTIIDHDCDLLCKCFPPTRPVGPVLLS